MRRPKLRLAVQLGTVVLLLTAVVIVLGPIRAELERRFATIKDQAVTELENLIGREVTYSSVSPSILRYLSVRDLTIHGRRGEPADLLTVGRLRVYYRPLRLLQGRYSEAFSEIRIENTELTLDTRSETDLTALLADILGGSTGGTRAEGADGSSAEADPESRAPTGESTAAASLADLLPDDFLVSGRNIHLDIRSSIGRLDTERLFFSTTLADETISVRVQGDARLRDTPDSIPVSGIGGRLEAFGTINVATGDTLLEVSLPELTSDLATLRSQVLQVRFSNGVLEARNVQNRDPIDIYVRYIDAEGELYARVLADGYRLSDLVQLEGGYAALNRYLRLPIRGQANATVTPDSLEFGGSILTEVTGFPEIPQGDLTLRFDGDAEGVSIDELVYDAPIGRAEYRGDIQLAPLRPSGVLSVRDLRYGNAQPLTLTARLSSFANVIRLETDPFRYAGTPIESVRGSLAMESEPRAEVTIDLGPGGASRLEIETLHEPDGTLRSARVDARHVRPEPLLRIQDAILPDLSVPDLSMLPDSTVVDARAIVDLTDGLSVDVPLFYAFDSAIPSDHLSFSLAYDDGDLLVRDVTAGYHGYSGRGDFSALVRNGGTIAFESDVVVEDVAYRFSGVLDPSNSLAIRGLYDVDARFYFGERGELIFRASGDIPLPLQGPDESSLAFAANGYYFSPDDWTVNVDDLDARGVPIATVPSARIGVRGSFSDSGGRIARLSYSDAFSELTGNGEVSWDLPSPSGTVALVLSETDAGPSPAEAPSDAPAGNDQPEAYEISASLADGRLDASASLQSLPIRRLGIETVRGALTGGIQVAGPLDALSTRVSGALVDGRFNTDPVELRATVEIDPDAIRVVDASGRYVRSRAEGVSGVLSTADGSLSLSGTVVQPGEEGDVPVGVQVAGAFEDLRDLADVAESDFNGTVLLSDLPVQEDLPSAWEFRIARAAGTTSISGGPNDAIVASLGPDGAFEGRFGSPIPIRFDAVGFLEGGSIEADLTNVWADVPRLWSIIATPDFIFTGGVGTGSVRIVGPVNDPDFYGTLVAEDVTADLSIIPDTLGPARTFLVFDEKILTVRESTVSAGPARARVSMQATLNRWLPEAFRVSIATEDDSNVRVANDFGGVMVEGEATGTITIDGDRGSTRISGSVTASSTTITLTERPESGATDRQPPETRVDITIHTDRGVQFQWPTDALPILRGFADVDESVRIVYDGAAGTFSVTGGVEIQGGEVFYFDRSFYIREGRITFDEDQQEFDPLLTVNAEIREVADEGPVTIYLVADERPLSEFAPQWRSDPPLSEAAILALLGGNVFVSESGGPIDLEDAAWLASDVVSQFAIIRGFENSVRDALSLDLFSIRTQLFQQLLRGAIDPDGVYPLDNQVPSLGQYLDNTTLFVGKYLGTDLFAEMLVQLSAPEPSATGSQSLAGIEIDWDVGLEWQTPFFLLEWTWSPRDWESLFLSDNTISFSWDYSY